PLARRQGAADPAPAEADVSAHHAQYYRSRAARRPRAGHDLSARADQAPGADRVAASGFQRNRVDRCVRPLRCADLGRPARGTKARHARRRAAARGAQVMTLRAHRVVPFVLGLGTLVLLIAMMELLIRAGVINKFIVPTPSQIAGAFNRVITEEEIPHRFLVTARESLWAALLLVVFGIGIGVLLYRVQLLRAATETW